MVSSASRLYDWQASRLGSPHLGAPLRTDSSTSQPDTLRKRECIAFVFKSLREGPYILLAMGVGRSARL